MFAFSDIRSYASPEERFSRCLFCGRGLYVLPNDRRGGACFDCLSLVGDISWPCPECGESIAGTERAIGCGVCGWYPGRP